MAKQILTAQNLRELVSYDAETGKFTRIKPTQYSEVGDAFGVVTPQGYVRGCILGRTYSAHRLAWLYVYGVWPKNDLDHINRIRHDNRLCNLREATPCENMRNMGRFANNTSGFKGVAWHKQKQKWQARCRVNGARKWLGLFDTAQQAGEAYIAFAMKHHGEFFRIE